MPTVASWIDELNSRKAKQDGGNSDDDDDDSEDEDWVPTEDKKSWKQINNSGSLGVSDAKPPEPVESEAKQEDDRKRKADLWSSFLKDVKGPKPKVAKLSSDSITEQEKNESISGGKIQERSSDSTILTESVSDCREKKDPKPNPTADKKSSPSKTTDSSEWIEVKRVYDFAGEEIVVTEKVAATSKQASPPITEVENAEKSQSSDEKSASSTKDSADRLAPIKDQESVSASPLITNSATGSSGGSRPGVKIGIEGSRLGSIVDGLGKKKKMGTLQKSALDWESFKSQQGEHLTEELNAHRRSKNSFLDRQDFLHRVDWAQFEIERDVRSKERKRTGAQNM